MNDDAAGQGPHDRRVRPLVKRLRDTAQGLDLGADGMGWSQDPALLREAAAEIEGLRAENAALKHDLQYARDGLTKGRTRMREDNERLASEAYTWSKAAETYAAEAERLRAVLAKIEAGEYLHLPTMVRDSLWPNAVLTGAALAQPEPTALTEYELVCREDGCEPPSALERLRFFCSLAMTPQDWLDVEPFFEALAQPAKAEPVAQSDVICSSCRKPAVASFDGGCTSFPTCPCGSKEFYWGVRSNASPRRPTTAEPVAKPHCWLLGARIYFDEKEAEFDWRNDPTFDNTGYTPIPLYAAPQQRKPLTKEEARALIEWKGDPNDPHFDIMQLVRAVERKHGICG